MKGAFINKLAELSLEVYEHLGGGNFDEKDYQKALGFEFKLNKIEYLREAHLELYYKEIPLKLGAPDFFLNKISTPALIELKLGSGLDDSNRHQLNMYLASIKRSSNSVFKGVNEGYLVNFLKTEPLLYLDTERKTKGKSIFKIDIEHFKLNKKNKFLRLNKISIGQIKT